MQEPGRHKVLCSEICMKCQVIQITFVYFVLQMLAIHLQKRCYAKKNSFLQYDAPHVQKKNWIEKHTRITYMNGANEAHFLTKHVFKHVPHFLKQTKCQLDIVFSHFIFISACGCMKRRKRASLLCGFFFLLFSLAYQWSGENVLQSGAVKNAIKRWELQLLGAYLFIHYKGI